MNIAGIGSRGLDASQIWICENLGGWIVRNGHHLHSGNATGADQAFARGANQLRPDLVHLHLPWPKYEAQARHPKNVIHLDSELSEAEQKLHAELANKHHPRYPYLSQGVKKLMNRNSSILVPPPGLIPVDLCLAFPRPGEDLGGTGQGMRVAVALGVKLVDLRDMVPSQLFELCETIAEKRENM